MKRNYINIEKFLCSLFFLILPVGLMADYPEIFRLSLKDPLYYQIQEDIKGFHREMALPEGKLPPLSFFIYTPLEGDSLLALAARLNLPYDTLASLNRLENQEAFSRLKKVLIPNQPGIFIPENRTTDLEDVLAASRESLGREGIGLIIRREKEREKFYFFPGDRFHSVERAFFLKILFKYPLEQSGRLTSPFGTRSNPFSGDQEEHKGIDLASPLGTGVLASREGIVLFAGWSRVLGNHIILSHSGNYKTIYGHLSEISVTLGEKVYTGMYIGKVGSTGLSTGPHLHFEIVKNGDPKDPLSIIR